MKSLPISQLPTKGKGKKVSPKLGANFTVNGKHGARKDGKPKRKAIKPTVEEYDARVEAIMDAISAQPNLTRYKLHAIYCKKWKVRWETIDRYLTRAREKLLEKLKASKEQYRSNAVVFYEQVISNPLEETTNKLKAQKLLVELLGVAEPKRVEVTGAEGCPLMPPATGAFLSSMTVDELKIAIGKLEGGDGGDNKV